MTIFHAPSMRRRVVASRRYPRRPFDSAPLAHGDYLVVGLEADRGRRLYSNTLTLVSIGRPYGIDVPLGCRVQLVVVEPSASGYDVRITS